MNVQSSLSRMMEPGPMKSGLPCIHIVDDDATVRNALARLIGDDAHLVRTFQSSESFLTREDQDVLGCVIVDVALPEMNGLALQQALADRGSHMPLIFLTGQADVAMCAQAMRHGAIDFLTKPIDEVLLMDAIARALEKHVAWRQSRDQRERTDSMLATLTPREREVLSHVMDGRLNKQIAADLGTAEKTVKVQRAHAMEKMHVRSVAALVRMIERAHAADPGHIN
jgi:FixJ family two-component response regulator